MASKRAHAVPGIRPQAYESPRQVTVRHRPKPKVRLAINQPLLFCSYSIDLPSVVQFFHSLEGEGDGDHNR
jgi:hypothetical protein